MKLNDLLNQRLAHPLTRGMDIDQPQTTALRQQIISSKPFLEKLYEDWYCGIAAQFLTNVRILELGSEAGFLKGNIPKNITNELFQTPSVDLFIDAQEIEMAEAS